MCQERQKPRAVSVGTTLRVAEERRKTESLQLQTNFGVQCLAPNLTVSCPLKHASPTRERENREAEQAPSPSQHMEREWI